MAIVYRSNAPEYFRYLATIYNKNEILANPQLCYLLQDPYLKDDMELALTFNQAENGGYNEKREFIQFLLANGPELDAGTIMYYRNIILNDPEYDFIANAEFNDIAKVDEARENIYNKPVSKDNCFKNPCNYLGPFSVSMAKIGDSANFMTISNLFSTIASRRLKAKKKEEGGSNQKTDEEEKNLNEVSFEEVFIDTSVNLFNRLIPNIQANASTLFQCIGQQYNDFAEHISAKKIKPEDIPGDPSAIDRARALTPLVQFHLHQKLGDCSRLFDHVRSLNLFDPVQNTQAPVTQQGNKTVTGVPAPGTISTDADTVGTTGNTNPKHVKAEASKASSSLSTKSAGENSTDSNEEKIEYVPNRDSPTTIRDYNGSYSKKEIPAPNIEVQPTLIEPESTSSSDWKSQSSKMMSATLVNGGSSLTSSAPN